MGYRRASKTHQVAGVAVYADNPFRIPMRPKDLRHFATHSSKVTKIHTDIVHPVKRKNQGNTTKWGHECL
jgi:hypothetical protein